MQQLVKLALLTEVRENNASEKFECVSISEDEQEWLDEDESETMSMSL